MAKQKDFNSFLSNIEPSPSTVNYISSIQTTLRDYLKSHGTYKDVYYDSFLSGSYAKHTSIRPVSGENKRDVDIIIVTNYAKSKNSTDVIEELCDVLKEKSDYKNIKKNSHSVSVEMGQVGVDVVPVIKHAINENLYYIGNYDDGLWALTDPKGHIEWSTTVNGDNSNEYKPLVKIMKWWRRENCPKSHKYPKGITLEKIVADNLGDSTLSTEDFLISTIQNIVEAYKEDYVDKHINPVINDPSTKNSSNDLLGGYSVLAFSKFIEKLEEHSNLLNEEGTENDTWRKILGTEFPTDSAAKTNALAEAVSVSYCLKARHRAAPLWPIQKGQVAFISASILSPQGEKIEYQNNGRPLPKHCSLQFTAVTPVKPPYIVKWQVVNTGSEAQNIPGGLRGGFEDSNIGRNVRTEKTEYKGKHFIQCLIIKRGVCVARSKEYIINIM